jgi:dienelactone hydrolase
VTVDPAFLQEVSGANNGKYNEEENYKLTLKWLKLRTADIQFVLDTVLAKSSDPAADAVYHLIDPAKIGLMGHSLGGAAAVQVTREREDIDAIVNLDADLLGEYVGYADGKYVLNQKPFPAPILTIFTDDLTTRMNKIPNADEVVAAKHIKSLAPAAYEVHLAGTNHMSLTDLAVISPLAVSLINQSMNIGGGPEADAYEIIATMNADVLRFFNATLKGEGVFAPN